MLCKIFLRIHKGNGRLDVGIRLKSVRKKHGLSQRELAKRAGVTNSTISMIEKNSVSPSVSSLKKVLAGIPMSMVEFFSEESQEGTDIAVIYRYNDLLDLSLQDVQFKLVGKSYGKRAMAFLEEIYAPGSDTGEDMLAHVGEEAGIVISGKLEVTVNDGIHILEPGDSYYFDSTRAHRFRNPFDEPCKLISATTPANF
jgi:transcriptional regulator with XRE-family HTH domain